MSLGKQNTIPNHDFEPQQQQLRSLHKQVLAKNKLKTTIDMQQYFEIKNSKIIFSPIFKEILKEDLQNKLGISMQDSDLKEKNQTLYFLLTKKEIPQNIAKYAFKFINSEAEKTQQEIPIAKLVEQLVYDKFPY